MTVNRLGPQFWTHGELLPTEAPLARCSREGCNSPLVLIVALTVVVLRCQMGHVHELHRCFARSWFGED